GRAQQPLSDRGNDTADLGLAPDGDAGPAVLLGEGEAALALDEARAATPLDPERVAFGGLLVQERELALVDALDRRDADREGGLELVRAHRVEPLAAGRSPGQDRRVGERGPDAVAWSTEVMGPVQGHTSGRRERQGYRNSRRNGCQGGGLLSASSRRSRRLRPGRSNRAVGGRCRPGTAPSRRRPPGAARRASARAAR